MARIPFVTVTGFLGAGKTSLINAWLRANRQSRVLVLVNEIGAEPVDHLLVDSGPGQAAEPLPEGCLCCAYRGEAGARLKAVLDGPLGEAGFDRILIETSGLASPAGLERELMGDPDLAPRLRAAGVHCCVDAIDGPARLAAYPEAQAQIAVADLVAITKRDLPGADASAAEHAAMAWTAALASPEAALSLMFDAPPGERPHAAGRRTSPPAHTAIESFVLRPPSADPRETYGQIAALCAAGGAGLLRLKGVIGAPGSRTFAVQAVAGMLYPLVALPAPQSETLLVAIGERGLRARISEAAPAAWFVDAA